MSGDHEMLVLRPSPRHSTGVRASETDSPGVRAPPAKWRTAADTPSALRASVRGLEKGGAAGDLGARRATASSCGVAPTPAESHARLRSTEPREGLRLRSRRPAQDDVRARNPEGRQAGPRPPPTPPARRAHLGADLVAALARLDVHDLAHGAGSLLLARVGVWSVCRSPCTPTAGSPGTRSGTSRLRAPAPRVRPFRRGGWGGPRRPRPQPEPPSPLRASALQAPLT